MREFYVYGFKSRTEYEKKSARSYDNERRRIESWLGDYMTFRQDAAGKRVFISIDSRAENRNPLYAAFKSKSFTAGDITLHFILFDILHTPDIALTLSELSDAISRDYLSAFEAPMEFDDSTLRKKLREYAQMGLVVAEKAGRGVRYRRAANTDVSDMDDAIAFFSETAVVGVPGSFLLDRTGASNDLFSFKHHYITPALESEIVCLLFAAMAKKSTVVITNYSPRHTEPREWEVVPLRILVSVQSGRRYLLAYNVLFSGIGSYRLDYITRVMPGSPCAEFDARRERLNESLSHSWGVILHEGPAAYEHVRFTVDIPNGEEHILHRLEREKRCGSVTMQDAHTALFEADVYDTNEMVPWIRTFLCRITSLSFSNKAVEARFQKDLRKMYRIYGTGGETDGLS